MLAEDESSATVRAADGRGPLFWAHEAGNDEAIELLKVRRHKFDISPIILILNRRLLARKKIGLTLTARRARTSSTER